MSLPVRSHAIDLSARRPYYVQALEDGPLIGPFNLQQANARVAEIEALGGAARILRWHEVSAPLQDSAAADTDVPPIGPRIARAMTRYLELAKVSRIELREYLEQDAEAQATSGDDGSEEDEIAGQMVAIARAEYRLLALLEAIEDLPIRRCRDCGCTDDDCERCVERTGAPCSWIEEDLCSACEPAGGAR